MRKASVLRVLGVRTELATLDAFADRLTALRKLDGLSMAKQLFVDLEQVPAYLISDLVSTQCAVCIVHAPEGGRVRRILTSVQGALPHTIL